MQKQKKISFLFCSDPLHPKRADEDYAEEFAAAGANHACALFSYEELQEDGKLSLHGDAISGLTVYRGWMMSPELYRSLYDQLKAKNILLINTPGEYEKYHLLPGWYADFQDVTAKSVWEDQGTAESALLLTEGLSGSYIVKDYVKSRKHEWSDACFIADIANAGQIIRNFVERQGADLVGGVVLRQFEKLKKIGIHEKSGMPLSEEYRVFVYGGRILIIDDYWRGNGQIRFTGEEHKWIEMCAGRIKSNFASMDIARREDGSLTVIELGDGQVSGLQQIKPTDFYRAFFNETAN